MNSNEEFYKEKEDKENAAIVAAISAFTTSIDEAKDKLDQRIQGWYSKYGADGEMSYLESRKRIKDLGVTKRNLLLRQLYGEVENLSSVQTKKFVKLMKRLLPTLTEDEILHTKWAADGLDFAERVLRDELELKHFIEQELTKNLIKRGSAETLSKALLKKTESYKTRIAVRFQTEAVAQINKAQKQTYRENGVSQYMYRAVLDDRTSELCREMNGKVFYVSEMKVGINAPPLHPRCRSYTVPLV